MEDHTDLVKLYDVSVVETSDGNAVEKFTNISQAELSALQARVADDPFLEVVLD